ncbi:MAG: GNAT family N-acetyltransferase [Acidobacteriota bacterium]|nr:GNAT family N-acetyltransferase [Acidobacteriota bacterium]
MQPEPKPRPRAVSVRPVQPGDSVLLDRWRREPEVRRHQPLNESSVAQLFAELSHQQVGDLYRDRGDKYQWVVLVDAQAAGWITLVITNWTHGLAEIGYALSTPFQRQGLMPQALAIVLRDLYSRTSLRRIEARCAIQNEGSYKVLERLGFQREGRLRDYFVLDGQRVDNYLYAILRRDFLGR